MKAGDPTVNRSNVSEKQYQDVVNEEFISMLRETYGEEFLEEGFFDRFKGGAKKIGKAYVDVFKAYGEVMQDLLGISPEDPKAPDVPDPEELAKDMKDGDQEAVADGVEDMEDTLEKMKDKAEDEDLDDVIKRVDALIAQVRKMNQAAGGKGQGGEKTEDTEPLLDILDGVIDEWEAISGKTKDANLKKAMDYIEKIALAEVQKQRGRQRLKQIREKRKNG